MKKSALLILALMMVAGCYSRSNAVALFDQETNVHTIWIGAQRVDCGTGTDSCLDIKPVKADQALSWQQFGSNIKGFNYQAGAFYKLQVITDDRVGSMLELKQVLERTTQYFLPTTKLVESQKWQLNSLSSMPKYSMEHAKQLPFLTISNQGITGFSGCNKLFGKPEYLFEAIDYRQSKIKFSPLAMTRMACREPNLNQVEHQMTLILSQVNKFSVQWPYLNFYQDDKLLGQFIAEESIK